MGNSTTFCDGFLFNLFRMKRYRHTDNSLGIKQNFLAYMIKGKGRICAGDVTLTVNEGDLFFLPHGCQYHSYWSGEPDIEFISLGFLLLPNFEHRYYPPQTIKKDDAAVALMVEIVNAPTDAVGVGRLYTLIGMLLPRMAYQTKSRQTELVNKAKDLLTADPDRTVSEIARACAVSESTLYAAFKRHSDKSLGEVRQGVIMERAREMLVFTDVPIERISEQLHFSSASYFRKCFKAHFGAAPREIRKRFGV